MRFPRHTINKTKVNDQYVLNFLPHHLLINFSGSVHVEMIKGGGTQLQNCLGQKLSIDMFPVRCAKLEKKARTPSPFVSVPPIHITRFGQGQSGHRGLIDGSPTSAPYQHEHQGHLSI